MVPAIEEPQLGHGSILAWQTGQDRGFLGFHSTARTWKPEKQPDELFAQSLNPFSSVLRGLMINTLLFPQN